MAPVFTAVAQLYPLGDAWMEVFVLKVIDGGHKKDGILAHPVWQQLKLTLELQPNGVHQRRERGSIFLQVGRRIEAAFMKRCEITILRLRASQASHHLTRSWSCTDVAPSPFVDPSGQFRFGLSTIAFGAQLNSIR